MSRPAFRVGQTAYVDGRDPDADPPLTIRYVNAWDGVSRKRVKFRLEHGVRVIVAATQFWHPENRWYICVRCGFRRGWLPEVFLSAQREAPVGDLV